MVVPADLRPHLPPTHTGKANLTRALGTGNEREANRLAVPWIADFQAAITTAALITENPHGYDWITRGRAYHRGQNPFPPEARLFPPHPALALPETQTKPVPFDRIILLWAKQTNAPKKGKQDMETKCGRFAEWLGHDDMARVGFENCRDYRDAMIDEGDLSSGSILNHVKLLKALFTYAFDNEHITSNPMARIKYSAGAGPVTQGVVAKSGHSSSARRFACAGGKSFNLVIALLLELTRRGRGGLSKQDALRLLADGRPDVNVLRELVGAHDRRPRANDTAREVRPPEPQILHFAGFVQLSRAATPHTITGPALPNGAPLGPVMNPSLASFKMRNSSVRRPR
jgi:hypothetical protein